MQDHSCRMSSSSIAGSADALPLSYLNNHDELLPFFEAETAAIHRRDPDGARAACAERSEVMARIMLGELVRRRVFRPGGAARPATSSPGAPVAF